MPWLWPDTLESPEGQLIKIINWGVDHTINWISDEFPPLNRATSFAERLRLNLAVIHGEVKQDENEDDRNSPPPQEVDEEEAGLTMPPINRTPSKSGTVVI